MAGTAGRAGGFHIGAPEPAPPPGDLATHLLARAGSAAVALGIDAPIGLPRRYAAQIAHTDFPAFLRALAPADPFFSVAPSLAEVALSRPFYPARPVAGLTRAAHAQALGLGGAEGLSRLCDRATHERPAGAPLFWTLGANQSGKAAISLWRDALCGAAAHPALRLWPFQGRLHTLLAPGLVALAETYPAQCLRGLGLRLTGSKRRQADRAGLATDLRAVMRSLHTRPSRALAQALADGFGHDAAGEDRFDSVLGVLGVIAVLRGDLPDFLPEDPWITRWEGWVLGQSAEP